MAWYDDAIRGGDSDPNHGGAHEPGELFLDPWEDNDYVRTEDAE